MDKRGGGKYQDFPSKVFCLTVPKNFVGEPFCAVFQEISGSEKVMDKRRWEAGGGGGGVSRFSFELFLSHSAEKFCRGTLLCCVSEIFR